MAPEYVLWGQLTEKADVYSFGVVAMEIVSGKSNTKHKGTADHISLLNWVTFLFCPFDVYKFSLVKHLFVLHGNSGAVTASEREHTGGCRSNS